MGLIAPGDHHDDRHGDRNAHRHAHGDCQAQGDRAAQASRSEPGRALR
jgi:hypothetical protein